MHHTAPASPPQFETEFDWGGTKIYVTTCVVEG